MHPPWNEEAIRPFVDLLSRRWVLAILRELWSGPTRRVHLRARVSGVSHKSLTESLRDLEAAGLVHRTHYQEIPPRVEYELTARGRSVGDMLIAITECVGNDLTDLAAHLGGLSQSS